MKLRDLETCYGIVEVFPGVEKDEIILSEIKPWSIGVGEHTFTAYCQWDGRLWTVEDLECRRYDRPEFRTTTPTKDKIVKALNMALSRIDGQVLHELYALRVTKDELWGLRKEMAQLQLKVETLLASFPAVSS